MARQRATEEQDTAIKAAVDKATTELRSAPSAASEELSKQHAEELQALEERLVAKHREELEAARAKAQESVPAPAASPTAEEQKATIDAAVAAALAARDAEQRTKHQADIEKAVESGRLEGTMKLRLKDTALIRAQNKVKELESQVEEWKKAQLSQHHPHPRHQPRLRPPPPRPLFRLQQHQPQLVREPLRRANLPFRAPQLVVLQPLQVNRCVVVGEVRRGEGTSTRKQDLMDDTITVRATSPCVKQTLVATKKEETAMRIGTVVRQTDITGAGHDCAEK
ncbi:hypothetical protein EDB85DRAFT_604415 [Lactarius pseudohatsudake]|nr:hypothetical protein EDB85DRAFT_604415 [Lactarius pseudohatsudake]